MKKFIIGIFCISLLFSCETTKDLAKNIAPSNKLKGTWTLKNVEYYNTSGVIINVFDQADALCFEDSEWDLIPNNGKGKYTLVQTDECTGGTTNIIWNITKDSKFTFKKVEEGQKGKTVHEGYTLDFKNQTDTSFELLQHIPYDGKDIQIVYSFVKK